MEKTYGYWRYGKGGNPEERIEKTEDQLDQKELDLFYGTLLHTYDSCPPKVRQKFIHELASQYRIANNLVERTLIEEYENLLKESFLPKEENWDGAQGGS